MRLALKLALAFTVGNIALAAIYGYLAVERQTRVFEQTASDEAQSIGPPLQLVLADAWRASGNAGLQQCVREVEQIHDTPLHIRWVWFDRRPGEPDAPAVPRDRLSTVAIEQHVIIETSDSTGHEVLDIYWPVPLQTAERGGLEFSRPVAELAAERQQIVERTAWLIGGMVATSGLLAAWLGLRMIARPLRQLIAKTRRVGAGDLAGPVHLRSRDELAELAESLNQMCAQLSESQLRIERESAARIAAIEQLRHTDRLKTVGRLAAGIAHELGTPLNVVSGRAGLILSGKLAADEVGASAAAIKAEVDRMTRIIRQLLDFARVGTPRRAAADLRQLVGKAIGLVRTMAEGRGVRLCGASDGRPAIAVVDAEQMQQALVNLIVNAIQAMPSGGDVGVSVRREERCWAENGSPSEPGSRSGACWCIAIRDEGTGIPAQHIPHLFEPFFTTKDVGEGTGLGLSIAYGIVREHGGWIDVRSHVGEGSCFTICLPAEPTP